MKTFARTLARLLAMLATQVALSSPVFAATPAELLAGYVAQAGAPANPERGEKSCHGAVPTKASRHAISEKRLAPLAPAFNDKTFTDRPKVEGWFRINCKDVMARECTAQEKADVLAWLISLKP
jgi:hypothetical protein